MAESARSKVSRIQKWREKRKLKRDASGKKGQPADRRPGTENDEDRLHKIGRGGLFG